MRTGLINRRKRKTKTKQSKTPGTMAARRQTLDISMQECE